MTASRSGRLFSWFLAWPALPLLAACGSNSAGRFALDLHGPDGETPSAYYVLASAPDGTRTEIACPSEVVSRSRECTEHGVALAAAAEGELVTVKATGYSFVTLVLEKPELQSAVRSLELQRLSMFTSTADYRTGLTSSDGEQDFLSLAVSADTELGPAHSVKFYIADLTGSPSVYLQDTRRYPLHFEFAQKVLGVAVSPQDFARRTYSGEARNALAGTLTYYPDLEFATAGSSGSRAPLALEFFPGDDLSPRLVLLAHRLIEERLLWLPLRGRERRLTYVPAGTSQEQALALDRGTFLDRDAAVATHVDFYSGVEQQILNPGTAFGTLRVVGPGELERSVVSARDIVVLARLPNDVPLVGGMLTEELQTPLAHVNLAARARGTPNVALLRASSDPRVASLVGKLVRFEATPAGFSLTEASLADAEAFWASEGHERVTPQADLSFEGLPGFDELHFADFARVGSKAANLAELRQLLGDQAPAGFAVPFSAYERYISENVVALSGCDAARLDCESEGRSSDPCEVAERLCQDGATAGDSLAAFIDRLIGDEEFSTDSQLREACLAGVRSLIEHGSVEPSFAAALDARVAELFGTGKVRLRSSTNGEDLPGFSGAGLYESVSAQASGELRASARIRDVWASVWLWRAFEERQFWNVEQRGLRMAVAVNPAIDDEAANGVLITQNLLQPGAPGHYVNVQAGETEVTNPESGALPEVFSIVPGVADRVTLVRQRFSSLSPNQALLSDSEVLALAEAAGRVETHFAGLYQKPPRELALDIEFKFHGLERRLLIKQARPYESAASLR